MSYRVRANQRLAAALSQGEFQAFYQPIVELTSGRIIGAEALCRWPQRDGTFAPPEAFITQAESTGFVVQLGDWVMREALQQMKRWQQKYNLPLKIAINLSPRQFLHHDLVRQVEEITVESGLRPSTVEFEITESLAMHNADDTIAVLREFKSLGFSLALDDFGTGYSSLAYLKRFPLDKLKIDKAFVSDIPADTNDLAIVSAIIAMAHALGLNVQAEGVETRPQADFLADCGCEYAQGFLFGRALPALEFEMLLAQVTESNDAVAS